MMKILFRKNIALMTCPETGPYQFNKLRSLEKQGKIRCTFFILKEFIVHFIDADAPLKKGQFIL